MNGSSALDLIVMTSVAFLICRSVELLFQRRKRAVRLSWWNRRAPQAGRHEVKPVLPSHVPTGQEIPIVARIPEFDTSRAKVLHPAVAAEKFAAWMRENSFTDYLWVGEIDLQYLCFCKEGNYFPVELKGLRELLYLLPGVYHDRPRIGGAQWERFRRQMHDWYAQRGLAPPQRPVVVRILPAEMVTAARVRHCPGGGHLESGSVTSRGRTFAVKSKNTSQINPDARVQPGPIAVSANARPSVREAA